MQKKILIFSGAYFPKHVGGAEVAIKEITDRIPNDRYEFHMVTNRFDLMLPRVEQIGNVLVHRIGIATKNPTMADLRKLPLHLNKLLFQYLAYRKAVELHGKYHYDALWAVMAHSTGIPAALFKKVFPEVSFILNLQEGDPPEYIEKKMKIFGGLFKQAFVRADALQSLSLFLQSWGMRMGFRGRCNVVIPNAVDVKHFGELSNIQESQKNRRELGLESEKTYLVTTSRLVHKNGIDTVIRSLPLLPEQVEFVIFGTGPEELELKGLAEKCDVTRRVHFKGQIGHDQMPGYLKSCDIFIRPSRSEGMGASFVEAMAAGLPVVATQEGGISDFLFDAHRNPGTPTTGWAVDRDSPEQIAAVVKEIIENPTAVKKVVATAKEMVETKYDWDLIAKRMEHEVFEPLT